MPKYKIIMRKPNDGASDVVIVYIDKANAKAAYVDAVASAITIFGQEEPDKVHTICVEELPAV